METCFVCFILIVGICTAQNGEFCSPSDDRSCYKIPPRDAEYDQGCEPQCSTGLVCVKETCTCPVTTSWNVTLKKCITYGDSHNPCKGDCLPSTGLTCVNNKCSCIHLVRKITSVWNNRTKKCDAKKDMKSYNGYCNKKEDCVSGRGLICSKSKCVCPKPLAWSEETCKSEEIIPECNPDAEINECPFTEFKECDKVKKVCSCPSNMEYSMSAQACRLKAGELCYHNNAYQHGLCSSQYCIEDINSNHHKTCACPDVDGHKQIWSSDLDSKQECVTDYYNLNCTANTECYSQKVKETRGKLICKDNHCLCAPDLSYIQGYCVNGTRLYNENCSTDIGCKTDGGTSLTCTAVQNETKCICLSKRIRLQAGVTHVPLLWDNEKKICTLKTKDEKCVKGDECRSGYCQNGRCQNRGNEAHKIDATEGPLLVILLVLQYAAA